MLVDAFVTTKWSPANIKHYKARGYSYTKLRDELVVNVSDLPTRSGVVVRARCTVCARINKLPYDRYNNYLAAGLYVCNLCKGIHLRRPVEVIQALFVSRNYTPIFTTYKNTTDVLEFRCNKHPDIIQTTTVQALSQKVHVCNSCHKLNISGSNSHMWKGGVDKSIYRKLRSYTYNWKIQTMQACNFKCVITENRFDVIHHLYSYNSIVDEAFVNLQLPFRYQESEFTSDELEILGKEVARLHNVYPLGACLTQKHHKAFHALYGTANNTPEQFNAYILTL